MLIVVDTLRADRVGGQRDGAELTPNLDVLANDAVRFDTADAPAPLTMPSTAAMMTGRYPDRAGVVGHSRTTALRTPSPTLAELARSAGYETAAVVANPWLGARATRFDRGFETYVTPRSTGAAPGRFGASAVTDEAIEILEHARRPLLLWVHYIDAHMPYRPPPNDAAALGVPAATSAVVDDFVSERIERDAIYFAPPYDPHAIESTRRLYDASVRHVDREIGRLLAAADEALGRDRTIVVFTADHGESLGEHGLWFAHDFTLYEELTRVPLLVRAPGVAPARVEARVSLVDVLPTLCVLAPLACPGGFDGEPLPLAGRSLERRSRATYSMGPPYRSRYARNPFVRVAGLEGRWAAIRSDDLKLIRIPREEGVKWEAYDLRRDPAELDDVYAAERHGALAVRLESWMTAQRAAAETRPPPAFSPRRRLERDTLEALRALGYLE